MFSTILSSGPIWAEIAGAMIEKALITGGLTVIKAGPQIQRIANNMAIKGTAKEVSNKKPEVIDVFNCIDNK